MKFLSLVLAWLLLLGSGVFIIKNDFHSMFWYSVRENSTIVLPYLFNWPISPFALIVLTYVLVFSNFIFNLIFSFHSLKNLKVGKRYVFFSLVVFFAVFSIYFMANNFSSCGSYFIFCKDGWHYEKNFLGHKVDVHYKVDLFGNRIDGGGVGCGFSEENPDIYHELIMSIPGSELLDENEDYRIYHLAGGGRGILDKRNRPYYDKAIFIEVMDLTFKGTSCENNN